MTHVLITRPKDASLQLADQLDAHGLTPIVMPLYTFSPSEPVPDVSSAWSEGSSRKLAVFTSPRAVQFGLPLIPAHDQLNGIEIAVVGSATRAVLEAARYPVHVQAMSGFTSEDLLRSPALADDPGVAVIFCAPGGRETIAQGLRDKGWRVDMAMVYERVPLPPGAGQIEELRKSGALISVWTSTSAINLAEQYLPVDVWVKILGSSVLAISSRIQQHLVQLGASRVELAYGPGNPELLQSILRLTGQPTAG